LNIRQVINELKSQRRQLDKAIAALERVATASKSRRKPQAASTQSPNSDRGKLVPFQPLRSSKTRLEPAITERSERH
jgi:hypothetical protein